MTLKRFGWLTLLAVAAGALVGGALGFVAYLTGNPDFRSYGGLPALFYLLLVSAGIGGAVSLASAFTAGLFVGLNNRRVVRDSRSTIRWATGGAAAGAMGFWGVVGVLNALLFGAWWTAFGVFLSVGVVSAVLAAILSLIIVGRAERRSMEPVEGQ